MSRELEPVDPIRDEDDVRSIINLVPGYVSTYMRVIPEEVLQKDAEELEKLADVSESERKMRIAFWIEYERAQRTGTVMQMSNVFKGLCGQGHFARIL